MVMPSVIICLIKCCTNRKKLSGLPGEPRWRDGNATCDRVVAADLWVGRLAVVDRLFGTTPEDGVSERMRLWSFRRYSTVTPKSVAICSRRVSSGIRLPRSHGDHCCGDTPNALAHFVQPPWPGNFFIRQARILAAMVSRRVLGIFPIWLAHQ